MSTGLRMWNDAYNTAHQYIADGKKMALYERWRVSENRDIPDLGLGVKFTWWSPWHKLDKPRRMDKARHVRELTLEDVILGNYEEE